MALVANNDSLDAVLVLCAFLATGTACAGTVDVEVLDRDAGPLQDAVVTAEPLSAGTALPEANPGNVVIDQHGRQFHPWVVGMRAGATVTFANHDDITHHVYSFSRVKQFSFRIQAGREHQPIHFDHPGLVVIGCNIHDWMVGYIQVTESPYVAVTDGQGKVVLDGLDGGVWRLKVWHPGMEAGTDGPVSDVTIREDARQQVTLHVESKLAIRQPPEPIEDAGYQ